MLLLISRQETRKEEEPLSSLSPFLSLAVVVVVKSRSPFFLFLLSSTTAARKDTCLVQVHVGSLELREADGRI